MKRKRLIISVLILILIFSSALLAQRPHRVGTTTAAFLEIGYGSAGSAMGDAYVSMANDLSSIYWNPAGLAFMKQNEAQFVLQPWIVDIHTAMVGAGIVVPNIGTLAVGLISVDYGEMDVTTLSKQEGTGEKFSASDYAINLSYGRALTDWFAFGASGKYVGTEIWHMKANALALDLGVVVKTMFFSPTDKRDDGLHIGMSISNYGTRMKFDGIDLLNYIDVEPDQAGNYKFVPGQFRLEQWELPLIFRIGAALKALKWENQTVSLALDALHPNNSAEYVNVGLQYEYFTPTFGKFYLRSGYKGIFLPDSEFGLSLGAGVTKYLMGNMGLKVDYAFREMGLLGRVHSYSVGFLF